MKYYTESRRGVEPSGKEPDKIISFYSPKSKLPRYLLPIWYTLPTINHLKTISYSIIWMTYLPSHRSYTIRACPPFPLVFNSL